VAIFQQVLVTCRLVGMSVSIFFRRRFIMSKVSLVSVVFMLLAGCDSLRYAPGEVQKQNAWLHEQTARMAADVARDEQTSGELQGLTKLCEVQSRAFTADYGLPDEYPGADSAEAILAESNQQLAHSALAEARQRPDVWDVADGAIDLGIGIAALFLSLIHISEPTRPY